MHTGVYLFSHLFVVFVGGIRVSHMCGHIWTLQGCKLSYWQFAHTVERTVGSQYTLPGRSRFTLYTDLYTVSLYSEYACIFASTG